MKQFLISVLAGLGLFCAQASAQSLEATERLTKEFTLASAGAATLVIYNVNGFIRVQGGEGNKVSFAIDKRITAKDQQGLNEGKQEFKLGFEQKGDTIIAYIAEPFDSRPSRESRNWNRHISYDFTVDFTVRIPRQMNVLVATVNRGDVTLEDVAGNLKVRNVNGAIGLTNARGTTDAHTINGNVEANYVTAPTEPSSYYTLNGDIKVTYPANLSADLQFKSFQGSFYTDFPEVEVLPVQVVKNQESRGDKKVYKLSKGSSMRIGNGGRVLRFETFNGNVYIKKKA